MEGRDHPPVITASEAAERKGVSRQAVHQAADRGSLNYYYSGSTRLIVWDDLLQAWLGIAEKTLEDIEEKNTGKSKDE